MTQCAPMKMRAFVLVLFAPLLLAQPTPDKPMLGFSAASAAKQQALEAQFDSKLNRDELREWMRRLSARPHHLGSAYDKQNAEFIASRTTLLPRYENEILLMPPLTLACGRFCLIQRVAVMKSTA